jgi:hypothetical protein
VPALACVGWEGFFGACSISVALLVFAFIPGNHPDKFENSIDAITQVLNDRTVAAAFFGNMISIAFFNFFGISVTKRISATTRMVLDSVRTMVVWGFSIAVSWEKFRLMQLGGFVLLMAGQAVYNDIVRVPGFFYPRAEDVVQGDGTFTPKTNRKDGAIGFQPPAINNRSEL